MRCNRLRPPDGAAALLAELGHPAAQRAWRRRRAPSPGPGRSSPPLLPAEPRPQVHVLATELAERDRMLQTIHSMRGFAGSGGGHSGGHGGGDGGEDDVAMQARAGGRAAGRDPALRRAAGLALPFCKRSGAAASLLTLGSQPAAPPPLLTPSSFPPAPQVMLADRDFMQTQLQAADEHSGKLALALERMRRKLAAATGQDPGARAGGPGSAAAVGCSDGRRCRVCAAGMLAQGGAGVWVCLYRLGRLPYHPAYLYFPPPSSPTCRVD